MTFKINIKNIKNQDILNKIQDINLKYENIKKILNAKSIDNIEKQIKIEEFCLSNKKLQSF